MALGICGTLNFDGALASPGDRKPAIYFPPKTSRTFLRNAAGEKGF